MRLQPYVGLPNILAEKMLVPELLQDEATAPNIADAVFKIITDTGYAEKIQADFLKMHLVLKQDSAKKAASIVLSYLK